MANATFIVFEGIEGAGKTTQIALLEDHLRSKGLSTYKTREPGGTPEADEIRKCIVQSSKGSILALTELLLIQAARVEHVQKIIKPKLSTVDYILCDRYIYSSLAYQGYARGLDLNVVKNLNTLACESIYPDQVILLDADPSITLKRSLARLSSQSQEKREDRFENEALDFHHKVREGFLSIARDEPKRFYIANALQEVQDLHQNICKNLKGLNT